MNTYKVAIHLLLFNNEKILLSQRHNTGYEDGNYSLVAGHVEYGESTVEAAVREAREEVGIEIAIQDVHITGVMHRKSDDERFDFFAVVDKWEGRIENREEEKCSCVSWFNTAQLPVNTIPYIRRAVELTLANHENVWYEEYGWNTYSYLERKRKEEILKYRGIAESDESYMQLLNSIINTIGAIDQTLEKKQDEKWQNSLKDCICSGKILIGTPILQNLKESYDCSLSACTVITPPVNKKGAILYKELAASMESQLRLGTGIGIDLSNVECPEVAVPKIDKILYHIDNILREAHRRPVAAILTLDKRHPHFKEFIKCRDNKDFQQTRLNTSVFIDDDIDDKYIQEIASSINKCGEPGILFANQLNEDNATPQWKYTCTAPCAEIAMASNDACHFSYINLAKFVVLEENEARFDYEKFIDTIHTITRFLDDIVEYSLEHSTQNKYELVNQKRRIGIGIAGFSTALIKMGIPYNSEQGLDFAKKIVEELQYHSKLASVELAKRRGKFKAFDDSKYNDITWLQQKFPNRKKFAPIIEAILSHGLRNATTVAFPPTGTSSQLAGVSASFEPYLSFSICHNGRYYVPKELLDSINYRYTPKDSGKIIAQLLREEIDGRMYPEFIKATKIDVDTQLQYTRIFQNGSDGSASKTINVPQTTNENDIKEYIYQAKKMKLKGITFFKEGCQYTSYKDEC